MTTIMDITNIDYLKKSFEELLSVTFKNYNDVKKWMSNRTELLDSIDSNIRMDYIKFQSDTSDNLIKKKVNFENSTVVPLVKKYEKALNIKYTNSPFRLGECSSYYLQLDKQIETAISITKEENILLEIDESNLITKYFEVMGNLKVNWEGELKTLSDLQALQQSPDRGVRKKALVSIYELVRPVEDKLQDIMDELIRKRHQIARNAGFENYRDYMFKKYERYDYSVDDCNQLAESIKCYLLPLQTKLYKDRKLKLGLESFKPWDKRAIPKSQKPLVPTKNTFDLLDKCTHILNELSPDFGKIMEDAKGKKLLDLNIRPNKAFGGFSEYIPDKKNSFIFMNANQTQDDVVILLHEMGHSVHHFLIKDFKIREYRKVPMETSELASMAMELFSMDYWNVFYKESFDLKRSKLEQYDEIINSFPSIIIVDQFQHWMYENPNHTRVERNDKFQELMSDFTSNEMDYDGLEDWQRMDWLFILHIFELPFYYIEYAIAQVGALKLYKQYKETPIETLNSYKNALSLGNSKSMKEVYKTAGISFDFSQKEIKELIRFVDDEVNVLSRH
ncbi:M3 family oligoendopeptidase [Paraliobacillus zengyii]|uniref:M3 family oligoendopeptidase n=1 Tax=Paraliobacillus zengyii TaxID=2213194 RepID=UPI000DD3ABE2|nr:M3 family oligoendopeptidase [Paraliobacillus zengyii]